MDFSAPYWMSTFSGNKFYPHAPEHPESLITLDDLVQGLSQTCRFAGQCRKFYSVAEHSVHLSRAVPPEHAKAALFHDISEGILHDINGHLKRYLPQYKELENRLMRFFSENLHFDYPLSPIVKEFDYRILHDEMLVLFKDTNSHIANSDLSTLPLVGAHIKCWDPSRAGDEFMRRYYELYPEAE